VEWLTHLPPSTREETFVSYLAEINSINQEIVEHRPDAGLAFGSGGRDTHAHTERGDELGPVQEEVITDRIVHNLLKRPSIQENAEDGNSSGSKRQRLGQSDMPQQGEVNLSIESSAAPAPASFSNYMEKTSPRANSLFEQPHTLPKEFRPPNGSGSFGENPLNLDHVLSSIVCTQIDEDQKAHIGETHLTFSTSEAKREVQNAADWAAAWRRASEAVVFAFPH